ncbi:family 1 glycosylhydrolase [Mesotoga sp. UBA6090]|uniref:family 1 glycosylhydrolase n=1 Tax=Mesotoga sp. UBA6090 TaxID=1946860 RepID=UPI0039C9699F
MRYRERYCGQRHVVGCSVDYCRTEYLREHFSAALNTIKGGVDLRGCFVWTLMDNFEWARGYSKSFGLVLLYYNNDLKRIPKTSFEYYRDSIKTRRSTLHLNGN